MTNSPYLKLLPTSATALAANAQRSQAAAANPTRSHNQNQNINEATQPSLRLEFTGGTACDTTEPDPEPSPNPSNKKPLTPAEKAAAVEAIEKAFREAGMDVKDAQTLIDDILGDRVEISESETGEKIVESSPNANTNANPSPNPNTGDVEDSNVSPSPTETPLDTSHLPTRSSTVDVYCGEK